MWRSKFSQAVLLSLALHFILIFALSFQRATPPLKETVQFEIRDAPVSRAATGKGHGRSKGKGKSVALGKLTPSWTPGKSANGFAAASASASSDSPFAEEEWGSHGGKFGEIEHDFQYQRLMIEARGLLYYPAKLGKRGVQGGVNARIYFSADSQCDWTRSKVGGDNHYLKVYILGLLKKLCSLESVRIARFKEGQFADFSFDFSIDEQLLAEQNTLHSNVLLFRRSYQKSMLEYNIGPFHGYFFAPAMTLDTAWIVEHWDTYVNGHDPLKEFRDP